MADTPTKPDPARTAARAVGIARVIFAMIVISLPILVFAARHAAASAAHGGPGAAPPMEHDLALPAFAVLAILTAIAIPFVRRRILPRAAAPSAIARQAGAPAAIDETLLVRAAGKYVAGSIVSWGLCEAIAIYGVALTLMTHEALYATIFGAAAMANLVAYAPKRAHAGAIARAAAEATRRTSSAGDPRPP